jgi:hypothetical protein
VELSDKFRDWSIRYHSKNQYFTVNERNSNSKTLKENFEKMTKNISAFRIVGIEQMEQKNVVLFLPLKGLSKKPIRHELAEVPQENAVSYSTRV